jgi:hypothetical protein
MFWWNILPLSSGLKGRPSKKQLAIDWSLAWLTLNLEGQTVMFPQKVGGPLPTYPPLQPRRLCSSKGKLMLHDLWPIKHIKILTLISLFHKQNSALQINKRKDSLQYTANGISRHSSPHKTEVKSYKRGHYGEGRTDPCITVIIVFQSQFLNNKYNL